MPSVRDKPWPWTRSPGQGVPAACREARSEGRGGNELLLLALCWRVLRLISKQADRPVPIIKINFARNNWPCHGLRGDWSACGLGDGQMLRSNRAERFICIYKCLTYTTDIWILSLRLPSCSDNDTYNNFVGQMKDFHRDHLGSTVVAWMRSHIQQSEKFHLLFITPPLPTTELIFAHRATPVQVLRR